MSEAPGPSSMHPDDPKFEEWSLQQLENDTENEFISDDEESYVIESEHESDTEQSEDENQEEIDLNLEEVFFLWT